LNRRKRETEIEAAGETGKDMGRKSGEWRRDIQDALSPEAKTALLRRAV